MICEIEGQLDFGFGEVNPEDEVGLYIDAQIKILLDPKSDNITILNAILAAEKNLNHMTQFQYAEFIMCFMKFFMKFVHREMIFRDVMWKIFHKIMKDHLREEEVI